MLNDGWTAVSKDKKLSAQFEHTLGITEKVMKFLHYQKWIRSTPYSI